MKIPVRYVPKRLTRKDKNKQVALRVSVDGGGCSGFMYNYQLVGSVNNDDFILENYYIEYEKKHNKINFANM